MKLGYIIASHQVTESNKAIGYFYREEPDNDEDSGWRVFSGEETQEYAADANNFSMYNASTIVQLEPSIAPLLALEYPIAFERDAETGTFCRVEQEP